MKTYTAGIIGYGGMAGNHEKVMRVDYDRMKLKGIFDISEPMPRQRIRRNRAIMLIRQRKNSCSTPI